MTLRKKSNSNHIQKYVSKVKVGLHNSSESVRVLVNQVPFGEKKDLGMKNTLLLNCVYRVHISIPQQK